MKLLGDWNWYLPKHLRWLPRLERERPGGEEQLQPALEPTS
jgi:putative drug exporter of the RND superfamily